MPGTRRRSRATGATSTRRRLSSAGGKTFVRDVKDYVKQYLGDGKAVPRQHVIVYDEAQRAWDLEQVTAKHSLPFPKSEPEAFVDFGERIPGWCVLVGLIGSGRRYTSARRPASGSGAQRWRRPATRAAGRCTPRQVLDEFFELRFHFADDLDDGVELACVFQCQPVQRERSLERRTTRIDVLVVALTKEVAAVTTGVGLPLVHCPKPQVVTVPGGECDSGQEGTVVQQLLVEVPRDQLCERPRCVHADGRRIEVLKTVREGCGQEDRPEFGDCARMADVCETPVDASETEPAAAHPVHAQRSGQA